MTDHAVMAYKGTETDILYGVAVDHMLMAYTGTETDILRGLQSCELNLFTWNVITFSHVAVEK